MSFPKAANGCARRAKITAADAIAICDMALSGQTTKQVSEAFGVSAMMVKQIRSGRSWFKETIDVRRKYQRLKG